MNILTRNIRSCFKANPIPITQEVIGIVEFLTNKDGIKYLLKLKDHKEVTIREYDDENDNNNDSISGVGDDDEE